LAYAKLSSGKTLGPIAQRFAAGHPMVIGVMSELKRLAATARDALFAGDRATFLACLDAGMEQRLILMPGMDPRYRRLIETGRATGSHVTFPGSGGAVVGSYEVADHLTLIKRAYSEIGATVVAIVPTNPRAP